MLLPLHSTCRYVVISKWKDERELDLHFKTAHVKEFGEAKGTQGTPCPGKLMGEHSSIERLRRYTDIPNLQYY